MTDRHAGDSRYEHVELAFGTLAESYDRTFDPNAVIGRLRKNLYKTIERLVPPPANILDINCGTGTDAIHFASRGYSTTGVDVTGRMIFEARSKSRGIKNVSFVHTSFDNLGGLEENAFDLVVSNFGGLNCADNLTLVGQHVARRLKPGGFFVAVLMPPFSFWETCAYLVRGQFGNAFRRLHRSGTPAEFSGRSFSVYYFTPTEAADQLAAHFDVRDVYAWNIVTPPPHAWRVAASFPALTRVLEKVDSVLCRLPLFKAAGDHYVMTLQKRRS